MELSEAKGRQKFPNFHSFADAYGSKCVLKCPKPPYVEAPFPEWTEQERGFAERTEDSEHDLNGLETPSTFTRLDEEPIYEPGFAPPIAGQNSSGRKRKPVVRAGAVTVGSEKQSLHEFQRKVGKRHKKGR